MYSAVGNVRCNLVSSVDTKVLPPGKKRSFRLDSGNPGSERENDREKNGIFWGRQTGNPGFFSVSWRRRMPVVMYKMRESEREGDKATHTEKN